MKNILISILFLLSIISPATAFLPSEMEGYDEWVEIFEAIDCPEPVGVEYPYRLWLDYKDENSWVDVFQANCKITEITSQELKCDFTDTSPITKLTCIEYDMLILIEKENSKWSLFDYHDELKMMLILMEGD